jgi:hypothetical protein
VEVSRRHHALDVQKRISAGHPYHRGQRPLQHRNTCLTGR